MCNYLQTIFLFLILFFRSYEDNDSITDLLKSKFQNSVELYDDMTRSLQKKRPNCEEILEKKNLWALNEEEFEVDDEMREEIITKVNDENQIVFSILKSKLNI